MPIVVHAQPTLPVVTAEDVAAILALQKAHCAPTTWDKFVRSLRANGFPYPAN